MASYASPDALISVSAGSKPSSHPRISDQVRFVLVASGPSDSHDAPPKTGICPALTHLTFVPLLSIEAASSQLVIRRVLMFLPVILT